MARGGVFIAGGIPGKLLPRIKASTALQQGFLRPDCRFAGVRASLPLHVVLSKDPGLDGARAVALRALAEL
jgi:glucokinase